MSKTLNIDPAMKSELEKACKNNLLIKNILPYEELDSTNLFALELEKKGERSGTVIIAKQQIHGHGRMKRDWISSSGDVALSIILRHDNLPSNPALLPMISGLAVVDALQKANAKVSLKWPNDIIFNKKNAPSHKYFGCFRKLGGILVENVFKSNKLSASIIGIGLNLKHNQDLVKKVSHAGFLDELIENADVLKITELVLGSFDALIGKAKDANFSKEILNSYADKCESIGRRVCVSSAGNELSGEITKINIDGSLSLIDSKGEHRIYAGDVNFLSD